MLEVLGVLGVDLFGAGVEVAVVQEGGGVDVHVGRVGDVAVGVGEGELHRFDLQVQGGRAVDRVRREVETMEDAQRDQRREALAVGRQLVQAQPVVVEMHRADFVGGVLGEVVGA